MNPYLQFVSDFAQLIRQGKAHALGGTAPTQQPAIPANAPIALIFSPHPDDECIIGGLALRLLRQARVRVINVAVTLGSKKERRIERLKEVSNACHYLGFGLIEAERGGLENVNIRRREREPALWNESVQAIAQILEKQRPQAIFYPHEFDWHSTHVGTHFLVVDALKNVGNDFATLAVETEFWGQMQIPNLMVESSAADVADMVAAISFHRGEVRRNPYHLFLPAWMLDNVRRGTELLGGEGATAPDFAFATLYRMQHWTGGKFEAVHERGKFLPALANPASLFGVEIASRLDRPSGSHE